MTLYRRHNELQQVRYTQQNRDEDFLEKENNCDESHNYITIHKTTYYCSTTYKNIQSKIPQKKQIHTTHLNKHILGSII